MIVKKVKKYILIALVATLLLTLTGSGSAIAGTSTITFCPTGGTGSSGVQDAADSISLVFTIFSVLGPIFGSLFFVGMTVAGAATMEDKYANKRRKVLLYGFSVPVSIAFLEVVGNQLVSQDISCFFPNVGTGGSP